MNKQECDEYLKNQLEKFNQKHHIKCELAECVELTPEGETIFAFLHEDDWRGAVYVKNYPNDPEITGDLDADNIRKVVKQ